MQTATSGTGATQLTKSAVYDYNTGVWRTLTDENNQTTTLHYDAANLRLYETVRPDGGTTDIIHFADMLFADPDAPYTQADALTGNNSWSRKIIYNADDLVTDSWDARGIQTHITYDGLNRISQITYAGEPRCPPLGLRLEGDGLLELGQRACLVTLRNVNAT